MATPSKKSLGMEKALEGMFGFDRKQTIKNNICAPPPFGCGKLVMDEDFKDERSRREYRISSLCQKCQDEVFGV